MLDRQMSWNHLRTVRTRGGRCLRILSISGRRAAPPWVCSLYQRLGPCLYGETRAARCCNTFPLLVLPI